MLKKMRQYHFSKNCGIAAFLFAVLLGSVYANFSIPKNPEKYSLLLEFFGNRIQNGPIIKVDLLQYLLIERFKILIFLWLMGFVAFASQINRIVACIFGFCYGVVGTSLFLMKGLSGTLMMLLLLFPHGVIYILIFLFLCKKSDAFSKKIYQQRKVSKGVQFKAPIVIEYLLVFSVASALLIVGIYLEAYMNPDLIQYYLKDRF